MLNTVKYEEILQEVLYHLMRMDEGYVCKYCKRGTIRPIQFSLNQAIINCDNTECESFLEKWPWECIITNPVSESTLLHKHDKDSVCSSDSSGVHSDLGSSGFSQSSLADREVELLLRKNHNHYSRNHRTLERKASIHRSPWQISSRKPTNPEPLVARDGNCDLLNEMAGAGQSIDIERKLEGVCNEVYPPTVNSNKEENEFFNMLKDINFKNEPPKNQQVPPKSKVEENDFINRELEALLEELDQPLRSRNSSKVNGDSTSYDQSPTKALIPSLTSAFYEVSPSKNNRANIFSCRADGSTQKEFLNNSSNCFLPQSYPVKTDFLSPTSSGYSEENSEESFANKSLYTPTIDFVTKPKFESIEICSEQISTLSGSFKSLPFCENVTVNVKNEVQRNEPFSASKISESMSISSHASSELSSISFLPPSSSIPSFDRKISPNPTPSSNLSLLNDHNESMDNQILETVGMLKFLEQGSSNGYLPEESSPFKMRESSSISQALVSVTKDNASSQKYNLVQSNSFSSKDIKMETFGECLDSKLHSPLFFSQCSTEESNGKSSQECSSINLNSGLETPKKSLEEETHHSNSINNIKPLNLFHSENLCTQTSLDPPNIFTLNGSCANPVVTSNSKEPFAISPSVTPVGTSTIQDIKSDIIGRSDATPNLVDGDSKVVAENNSNFDLRNASGIPTLNNNLILSPLIRKVSSLDMENDLPPCSHQDHGASPSDESDWGSTDQEFIEMQAKIDKFNLFINSLENLNPKVSYDTVNENKKEETLPSDCVVPLSPNSDITKSQSLTASRETSQEISLKEDARKDALPTTEATDSSLSDVGNGTTVGALINQEPISVGSIKVFTPEDNVDQQQEIVKAFVQEEKAENEAHIDFSPAPEWDTKNNINAHRAKTSFKGGLKVDPWSVPELYIDELNIEVILKDASEDEKKETRSQKEKEENTKRREENKNSHTTLPSPIPESTLPSPSPISQVPLNLSEISNVAMTSNSIVSPLLCSSSSSQNRSCPSNVDTSPMQSISISLQEQSYPPLPEKVNIYKPISLLPEILDAGHFQDNLSGFQSSRNSKMRLSVGYQAEDGSKDKDNWSDSSETSENPDESNIIRPSSYFSSLLNNLKFDENFCTLASSNETESSIENFVSERLFDECDSSQRTQRDNPFIKNENQSPAEKHKTESFNCDFEEEEESDSEIPIVTIDANDELDIIIPERKQKSPNSAEDEDYAHPPTKSKGFYSPQIKEGKRSQSFEESNCSKRLKTNSRDFKCCGIFENSIPHANSCFSSNYNIKTDLGKSSEKDISIEENFPVKVAHCNVNSGVFTINKFYDNFGKLGGRLENCKNNKYSFKETSEFIDENSKCDSVDNQFFDDLYPPDRFFPPINPTRCINSVEVKDSKSIGKKSDHMNPNFSKSDVLENNLNSRTLLYTKGDSNENSKNSNPKMKNCKTVSKVKKKTKSTPEIVRSSSCVSDVIGHNPSVPEVLNFLRESGWAVTPCNPVINYNVLPHARSPTIVPGPLKSQYGNTGSDVVLWALTDEKVPYESKKDFSVNLEPKSPLPLPLRNVKPELPINRPLSRSLADNSNNFESSSFKQVHHNSQKGLKHFFNLSENLSTNGERLYPRVKVKQELDSQGEETINVASNSVPLKKLRTSDGSVYIRPPFIKKEPLERVEDEALDSDGSSEGCIELPDDFVAYEEIVKEGYDVGAPPTIPESLFIPPLPLKQDKRKRNAKENFKPPHSLKQNLRSPPMSKEERILSKAEDKLTDILSERKLRDVPNVVCMTVDGKLFVYHRKE